MRRLTQNTAARVLLKMVLSSDHAMPATGKTVAVTISKNGAAFANPAAGASTATPVGAGWYYATLAAADVDTRGELVIRGTAALCDDAGTVCDVVTVAATTSTVNTPVDVTTGRLTLIQGDDHDSADRLPTWTIENWLGPDLTGATAVLRILPIKDYQRKGDRTAAPLEVAATIDVDDTTVTVTAPLTAAQTLALFATDVVDRDTHEYQIVALTTGDATVTVKLAPVTVLHRIAPAE